MIDVALKEWKLICDLLLDGSLAFLLRKGGIHEGSGPGEFEVQHDRFALYPTFDHQNPQMLKAVYQDRLTGDPDPSQVVIAGLAEVVKVWAVPSRGVFDQLDDLHPWSSDYVDMRFDYRPDRPLYMMALRASRSPQPQTIAFKAAYAGCKSWVPLESPIDPTGATDALDEAQLAAIIERIDRTFGA